MDIMEFDVVLVAGGRYQWECHPAPGVVAFCEPCDTYAGAKRRAVAFAAVVGCRAAVYKAFKEDDR